MKIAFVTIIIKNLFILNLKIVLTFLNGASLSSSGVRPHTSARVLIEVQTSGTFNFNRFTFDAVYENVAYSGVGVGEESVTTGALGASFCGF